MKKNNPWGPYLGETFLLSLLIGCIMEIIFPQHNFWGTLAIFFLAVGIRLYKEKRLALALLAAMPAVLYLGNLIFGGS